MPRTEEAKSVSRREAKLDDALDDSFPASDPLASSPRHGGQHDKKAPLTDADAPHGVKKLVQQVKSRIKH